MLCNLYMITKQIWQKGIFITLGHNRILCSKYKNVSQIILNALLHCFQLQSYIPHAIYCVTLVYSTTLVSQQLQQIPLLILLRLSTSSISSMQVLSTLVHGIFHLFR